MKDEQEVWKLTIASVEDAIVNNRACRIDDEIQRIFTDEKMGIVSELVVIVARAAHGLIYGHVMFDRAAEQWRSFLLHSNDDIGRVAEHRGLACFHDLIVRRENDSLVYYLRQKDTSEATDSLSIAAEAMRDMITGFDPVAAWPDEPGPRHRLDFAPFDAYDFIGRQRR